LGQWGFLPAAAAVPRREEKGDRVDKPVDWLLGCGKGAIFLVLKGQNRKSKNDISTNRSQFYSRDNICNVLVYFILSTISLLIVVGWSNFSYY
jgi:hypothetical protein